ncbi:MAG: multidrug efflux SMR transporter [Phycisphaerales bacterium]|jgi:quaternary ammonium compound-resistance protein SugE|nr:multidrug efflux SMR transporter [Phycisphaerales bacterium]
MVWAMLIVAGLLEVVWASAMKASHGFTRVGPSVLTIVAMLASFGLLAIAMKHLPLGVAYGVWVGIGAVGAALVGWLVMGERLSPAQGVCIALIAAGILGLKLLTPTPRAGPDGAASPAESGTR